jgi:predicted GIY-YIG superfamily endonuclease
MEDIEYSIYHFTDPRTQRFIYIGLTSDPDRRYKEHMSKGGTLYPVAQELAANGQQLIFGIFEKVIGIKNAFQVERDYIRQYQPPLNVIHNSTIVRAQRELKQYREAVDRIADLYNFTLDEALIWHNHFDAYEAGDNWHTYQIIKRTIFITQKRLQHEYDFSESEILDIALEVSGSYDDLESRLEWLRRRYEGGR